MKCSADVRNLKIISIDEGKQVSTVKDLIIDPTTGSLAFFIIAQPCDYFGARIIAFEDILGLGDYALIINDSSVIQDVAHNPLAVELLKRDVKVIGAQVLTTKGCLIGKVREFMIEEDTGKIALFSLETEEGQKASECQCDQVITYGREIILIDQDVRTQKSRSERKFAAAAEPVSDKDLLKKKIEEFGKIDSLLKPFEQNKPTEQNKPAEQNKLVEQDTPLEENKPEALEFPQEFNVFEQRQLQFLVGKVLSQDVKLENGGVLKAGEQLSEQALAGVKSRQTLMQLTAHVVK